VEQRIGTGQLRRATCHYIELAAAGETVGLLRRGRLIAELKPVDGQQHFTTSEGLPSAHGAEVAGVDLRALRARASHYLDQVVAGETLEVIRDGQRLARICPLAS
jgi:antitoxin (DNA-binding transcriptional repressor) of toxin-antitoxin stability system